MCKKLILLVSFILLPTLVSTAAVFEPEYLNYWKPDSNSDLSWSNAANWEITQVAPYANRVPDNNDYAIIFNGAGQTEDPNGPPIVNSDVNDVNLVGIARNAEMIVTTGGSLTTTNGNLIIYNGTLTMTGGSLESAGNPGQISLLYAALDNNAFLNMQAGTLKAKQLWMPGEVGIYPNCSAAIILDGGLIDLSGDISFTDLTGSTDISMNVAGGTMVIRGSDQTDKLKGYVDKGWLKAYHHATYDTDETNHLNISYNSTDTIVTATGSSDSAYDPIPANDETSMAVPFPPRLLWTPGDNAATHDVYFGTSPASLSRVATGLSPAVYRASDANEARTTYYWRIDEVNGVTTTGNVWAFTTGNWHVLDDTEDYGDPTPDINTVWNAAGSATISLEPCDVNVHGDDKAMKLDFANSGAPYYSEANAVPANLVYSDSDWDEPDIGLLSIWYKGHANADEIFIELTGGGNTYLLTDANGTYADGNAIVTTDTSYKQLIFELNKFSAGTVDLSDINNIAIGVGDKAAVSGSDGTVYFDDIRIGLDPLTTNPTPADNATDIDPLVDLNISWDPPFAITGQTYDLYFGTDPAFGGGAFASGLTDPNDIIPAAQLGYGNEYHWQVKVNYNSITYDGTAWSLTAVVPDCGDIVGDTDGDCKIDIFDFANLAIDWEDCLWTPTEACDANNW